MLRNRMQQEINKWRTHEYWSRNPYVTAEDIDASEDTRQCYNTPAMDKLKCYHTLQIRTTIFHREISAKASVNMLILANKCNN
jgi:hypothetical protein